MKKFLLLVTLIIFNSNLEAEEKKAYFAGGCFWCMEESFDQVEGVKSVVSGYSGGPRRPTQSQFNHRTRRDGVFDGPLGSWQKHFAAVVALVGSAHRW